MKATINPSVYFPPHVYEDPDALLPKVADVDQPEVKVKPVPLPRSRKQLKTASSADSGVLESAGPGQVLHYYDRRADPPRPKPVRPPPRPPANPPAPADKPAVCHPHSNGDTTLQPPAGKPLPPLPPLSLPPPPPPPQPLPPPPLPPKRPPRPPIYNLPASSRLPSETRTSEQQPSRPSSRSSEKAPSESPDPPAVPPRPVNYWHCAGLRDSLSLQLEGSTPAESVYTEIDYREYVDILPEEDQDQDKQFPTGTNTVQSTPENEEINKMLGWLRRVSKSDLIAPALYGLSIEEEVRSFHQRAADLRKALRLYNLLMMKRGEALRELLADFTSISAGLDKMQKKSKTMDIAGGTTGAVGGVTAVLGIALAPVTMGASLIATAVGAGMVASAGGMGAHSVKQAKKKNVNKGTVERLVSSYRAQVADLERCLGYVLSLMSELRRYDAPRLQRAGADAEALKTAHLAQFVVRNCAVVVARAGGISSERLLDSFAREMDLYFSEKDGQKLKKSCKGRFSGRVQLLAENLQGELDHLNHMWEMFS